MVLEQPFQGDVTFTVGENSLKFTLTIDDWNWKSTSNSLVVDLSFASDPAISQTNSTSTVNGFQILTLVVNTMSTQITATLQEFAVLDGVTQAIKVTVAQADSGTQAFEFEFPYFASSLVYDPDFGVLLQNNAGNTGDGDGGSHTALIAGLAGGLGGLALLVVVVTILFALLFGWWKLFRHDFITKRRSTSMVNFDPVDEDEDEDVEVSSSE